MNTRPGLFAVASLLFATAAHAGGCDPVRGEQLFAKCAACHPRDESGSSLVGPNLHGIVGRKVGSAPGFAYSAPMAAAGGEWTPARLDRFLENPAADLPGTLMAFAGLRRPQDRQDLVCFLGGAPAASR